MERVAGRESELATLHGELALAAAGEPRLVVMEGSAGIGKTQLIGAFLAQAGVLVRHALSDEVESTMLYGVLDQLFGEDVATLRLTPRADPVAAGALVLAVLGRLQQRHGCVVVVVDDAHWADLPSLQAMLFSFRRLQRDQVLVLLAVREEESDRIPAGVHRVLAAGRGRRIRLDGLDADAIGQIAAAVGVPGLSKPQLRRLTEHTGGNPLYARALLQEMPPEELRAVDLPLPAPRMFARATSARLARTSEPSRRLVTAVAVAGGAVPLRLAAAIGDVGDAAAALDEAVETGLLARSGPRPGTTVRPAHPLIGAAVYQDLPEAERVRLHRAAADALSADRGAWFRHRLAAATGADEGLAAEIADYAHGEADRGAVAAAATALVGAARVAERAATRERLLLEAIELSLDAADVPTATELAARIEEFAPTARRDWVRGWMAMLRGAFAEAEDRLVVAWNRTTEADDKLRSRIALKLMYLHLNRGRGDRFVEWSRRALAQGGVPDPTGISTAVAAVGL
jgi:hypothetical protein